MEERFIIAAADEAVRTVLAGTGGPFGAVIVKEGQIVGRGSNHVLETGDPTRHAEIMAIRDATENLGRDTMLELVPTPEGTTDTVPMRVRMLLGCDIYVNGAPCPMCMSAIYWARISRVYFGCGYDDTSAIGFDDAFQYEDFARPLDQRRMPILQFGRQHCLKSYQAWANKKDRIPF